MPWSGGVYTRTNGVYSGTTVWAQDAAAGTNITTGHHDTHDQDLATGLNNCATVDGTNKMTADFKPNADASYNLGSSSARWNQGYFAGTVTLSGAFNEPSVTLASASTLNIGAAAGTYIIVTGTTAITAFDTVQAGTRRRLKFSGVLTLTYDATKLILPGAANITTAVGDTAVMISEGSGNWRCTNYTRAAALPAALAGDLGNTDSSPQVLSTHLSSPLPIAQGGTGATTLAGASIVTGPASSTANHVPKFSDTTGKVLADGYAVGTGNNNLVQLDSAGRLPAVNGSLLTNMPFSGYFQSGGQTITAAGSLTIAHGLSATPILIQVVLKCLTSEGSYSIGDLVLVNPHQNDVAAAANRGVMVIPDGTNLNIRFGSDASTFALLNKSSGMGFAITNSNWNVIFRAWC